MLNTKFDFTISHQLKLQKFVWDYCSSLYSISGLKLLDESAWLFHRWFKMPDGLNDYICRSQLPQADELQIKILISETEVGLRNLKLVKSQPEDRLIDKYVEYTKLMQKEFGRFEEFLHLTVLVCALYRLFEEGAPDYDAIPEHKAILEVRDDAPKKHLNSAAGLNEIRAGSLSQDAQFARKYSRVSECLSYSDVEKPEDMPRGYQSLNPQDFKYSVDKNGNVLGKIQEERMRQYFGWSTEELEGLCLYLERVYPDVEPSNVIEVFKVDPQHRKLFEMCTDGMDLAGFVELYTRKQISFNRGLSFFDRLLQRYGSSTLAVFHSALSELI